MQGQRLAHRCFISLHPIQHLRSTAYVDGHVGYAIQ